MHSGLLSRTIILGAARLSTIALLLAASPCLWAADETKTEIPAPAFVTLLLARDPAIHAELKLTPQQQQAVRAAVAKVDQPLWQLRDVPPDRCAAQLDEQRKTLRQALQAALSPEQMTRFDQLVVQARGAKALLAPDVQQQLKLTADQVAQLRPIIAAAKGGTLDSRPVVALLSSEQQSALAALFGQRFDLGRVTYVGCNAPELRSVEAWINSSPLTLSSLRGKVVVVHFWAFGCINCVHNLPHYQAWYEKFPESDVQIIGIHTPETSAERDLANLRANIKQRGIEYPVAFDLAADNWKAWANNMWPSVYLIDRQGRVRTWWYGELNWEGAGGEEKMRQYIEQLVAEK